MHLYEQYVCMHAYIDDCMYICMHAYMHVCMDACRHVCMHVLNELYFISERLILFLKALARSLCFGHLPLT